MLSLAQNTTPTQSQVYEDMPLRAYAITFIYNDSDGTELPEQVYQGRSVSQAVQQAEKDQLDKPRLQNQSGSDFKAAWIDHWKCTSCKPRFIVGKVRDLGLVMNQCP